MPRGRPHISVCMAVYNGEMWISAQLASILSQLNNTDEVVIVDDNSCDNTTDIIEALHDTRIRLLRNEKNIGVNRSFERALGEACGEIIFLSDQDDIWYDDKVTEILHIFTEVPEITLVHSDADIIDEASNKRDYTYFENRGKFIPGVLMNILKSKFLGCTIAFRASLRKHCLPFPRNLPGHDIWIGIVNEWYGKTQFIEKPLIAYRRHHHNASPETHRSVGQMLLWRWQLIVNLFIRILTSKYHSRI